MQLIVLTRIANVSSALIQSMLFPACMVPVAMQVSNPCAVSDIIILYLVKLVGQKAFAPRMYGPLRLSCFFLRKACCIHPLQMNTRCERGLYLSLPGVTLVK